MPRYNYHKKVQTASLLRVGVSAALLCKRPGSVMIYAT